MLAHNLQHTCSKGLAPLAAGVVLVGAPQLGHYGHLQFFDAGGSSSGNPLHHLDDWQVGIEPPHPLEGVTCDQQVAGAGGMPPAPATC